MPVAIVTLYTYTPHTKLPLKVLLVGGNSNMLDPALACEFWGSCAMANALRKQRQKM